MNRGMSVIVALLMCVLTCGAQQRVSGTEQAKMVKMVEQAASKVKTMQCDFRQTKTLKLLNDKMVSTGVMYYSQPSKLRWQYLRPYDYTFVINGSKVMMKSGTRQQVIDAHQSKVFKEITQIVVNSVTGKCLTDSKAFKVAMYKTGKEWTAHLAPQSKELKGMFRTIVLHIDPKKNLVTQVDLVEKGGDTTCITLTDYKLNVPIDAKKFTVR